MNLRSAAACLLSVLLGLSCAVQAQPATIPVLMLSDIHFDPFRDQAKVAKLAAAPVSGWEAILKEPASATQAADFAALQTACKAVKGVDTDESLFDASLTEEKSRTAGLKFVTVSGDLLVHQFDCRYKTTMKTDEGYADFASKTASYVMRRLEATFAVPVYLALGNNDSSCKDYQLDLHDKLFTGTSEAVMAGLKGASPAELKKAKADYETGGYFGITLNAPMAKTRLLAIDDMYLSKKWKTCGAPDAAAPAAMMTWLKAELDAAAKHGERVWVMGHIPPGIDVYGTLKKGNVCKGDGPDSYLSPVGTETLGDVLAAHREIKLAIFGHTHMDEMKLLGSQDGGVPMKGVPSISPVDGNLPSFTVAAIDPATATMLDYTVYVAPNTKGTGSAWAREYSFDETYGQKAFTGATVAKIAAGFHADPDGAAPASKAYEEYFDKGLPISPLVLGWAPYACGIDHMSESGYAACGCGTKP